MEEFRPVVVDWLVLDMVNQGQITSASFEQTPNPKLPVRLAEPALDLVIKAYEERLAQRIPHSDAGGQTSRRRVIELQVRRLAGVVMDKNKGYRPFKMEQGQLS